MKTHTFHGFSIEVPEDTVFHEEDDGAMLVFTLPGTPSTDILAGVFLLDEQLTVSDELVRQRLKQYGIETLARVPNVRVKFFAVTTERKLTHPATVVIARSAKAGTLREDRE